MGSMKDEKEVKSRSYYENIIAKIYKQNKVVFIFISMIFFTLLYYLLGKTHFITNHSSKFHIFDCLYMSVVTQTLLGPGDMLATTRISRLFVMIQAFITLYISLLIVSDK